MSSVISASYYLKIIKIIMFDEPNNETAFNNNTDSATHKIFQHTIEYSNSNISPIHAFTIATSTAFITLFILDSELLINSIELAIFTI